MTQPQFFMCPPKPHRIMTRYGMQDVQENGNFVKLFKVRFYGPRLADTDDGLPCWFQASAIVPNYKAAVAAFDEWVIETKRYIEGQ